MAYLKFLTTNHWEVARFKCTRLTDPATLTAVGSELEAKLKRIPVRGKLAICFSGVEFVSSQIISLILMAKQSVEERGGELVLTNLSKHVAEVLTLTKLDRLFRIADDVDEVVQRPKTPLVKSWSGGVDWVD